MKKITSLLKASGRKVRRGLAVVAVVTTALAPINSHAAAAADAAITAKVDDAKETFTYVLGAGLTITVSMIGWGFLKRVRKG